MWVYTSNQCALSSWRYHSSLKNTRAHTNHTQSAAITLILSRHLVVRQRYANVADVADVFARSDETRLPDDIKANLVDLSRATAAITAPSVDDNVLIARSKMSHCCSRDKTQTPAASVSSLLVDATTNYSVLIFGASKYLFFAFHRRSHQVTNRPNACHE